MTFFAKLCCGAGVVLMLITGGTPAWAEHSDDPLLNPSMLSPLSEHLMALRVVKAGTRLISVGERGTILLSDDQGKSWRQVIAPVRVTLTEAYFPSPENGWVVGNGGVILVTHDGGETWTKQLDGWQAAAIEKSEAEADLAKNPTDPKAQHRLQDAVRLVKDGPDKPLFDVYFFDDQHGFVIGAYGLAFRTADGGKSWHSFMNQTDDPDEYNLYAINAAPDGFYIAGELGGVYKSTDGAMSFHRVANPGKGTYFGVVSSPQGAVVVYGLRGAVYRTDDGGINWDHIVMPKATLTGGTRLSDGSLLLVDETGGIWRSSDGGKTFQSIPHPESASLSGVVEVVPGLLVLSTSHGNIRFKLPSNAQETSK